MNREAAMLLARLIAAGRVAIGMTALLAPQAALRLGAADAGAGAPGSAAAAVRLAGVRDLALGAGALLAARRDPERLRAWVEAGGLADAGDVLIFGTADGLRPAARWGSAALAAGAVAASQVAARNL